MKPLGISRRNCDIYSDTPQFARERHDSLLEPGEEYLAAARADPDVTLRQTARLLSKPVSIEANAALSSPRIWVVSDRRLLFFAPGMLSGWRPKALTFDVPLSDVGDIEEHEGGRGVVCVSVTVLGQRGRVRLKPVEDGRAVIAALVAP